jgi:hypothetical protein
MSELGEFQRRFVHALMAPPGAALDPAWGRMARRLAVHRNTVLKGLVDSLSANYPTVERLVGGDWFRACAAAYAREHVPHSPVLALYGRGFADFLEDFPPAVELPYLADVARLDRLHTESFAAANLPCVEAAALAALPPARLFERRLGFHPAARWTRVCHGALTIWLGHRRAEEGPWVVDAREEFALVTRPDMRVECGPLDAWQWEFLERIAARATLGEAAVAALATHPQADLAAWLSRLVTLGAFTRIEGESS